MTLLILTGVFVTIAVLALIVFILTGWDIKELLVVTIVAGLIAIGCGCGAMAIKNTNVTYMQVENN